MPTIVNRIGADGTTEQHSTAGDGVVVRQLPMRDRGGVPMEQRTRAMSEIGPTTYTDGKVIYPTDGATVAGADESLASAQATDQPAATTADQGDKPASADTAKPAAAAKPARARAKK